MQQIETKNRYSPLETEENPTEKGNTRTDSPNTNVANTATQNIEDSNDKTEIDTPDKRKSSQLPLSLMIL